MFRTVPLSIIRSFFTVHTAMVYVIQVCWQLASRLSANLYILLCVQWKTPDDGQRNCLKHVEFYSKNKFEKLGASSWFYYKSGKYVHKNVLQCTLQNIINNISANFILLVIEDDIHAFYIFIPPYTWLISATLFLICEIWAHFRLPAKASLTCLKRLLRFGRLKEVEEVESRWNVMAHGDAREGK